jgi:nucleotide-binding universal stress UspA family protein
MDGSEESLVALTTAIRLARALRTSVRVIAAWHYPADFVISPPYGSWSPEHDARLILDSAKATQLLTDPPEWITFETHEGATARVLIDQSRGSEMLVVGSRGHGAVAGLLLGSVSAACAERAECPVLIVR